MARRAVVPLRYVQETVPEVPAARTRGMKEAAGHWIAYFDDDQEAEPNWLGELYTTAINTGAQCVGGQRILVFETESEKHLGPLARAVYRLGNDAVGKRIRLLKSRTALVSIRSLRRDGSHRHGRFVRPADVEGVCCTRKYSDGARLTVSIAANGGLSANNDINVRRYDCPCAFDKQMLAINGRVWEKKLEKKQARDA